jgi:hypothetical protein
MVKDCFGQTPDARNSENKVFSKNTETNESNSKDDQLLKTTQ